MHHERRRSGCGHWDGRKPGDNPDPMHWWVCWRRFGRKAERRLPASISEEGTRG